MLRGRPAYEAVMAETDKLKICLNKLPHDLAKARNR